MTPANKDISYSFWNNSGGTGSESNWIELVSLKLIQSKNKLNKEAMTENPHYTDKVTSRLTNYSDPPSLQQTSLDSFWTDSIYIWRRATPFKR